MEQNQILKVWLHGGVNSDNFILGLFLLDREANERAPGDDRFGLLQDNCAKSPWSTTSLPNVSGTSSGPTKNKTSLLFSILSSVYKSSIMLECSTF